MKKLFALVLVVFCFALIASAEDGDTCTLMVRGLSMREDGTIEINQIDSEFSVIKDGTVIGSVHAGESFDASADTLRPATLPTGWHGEDTGVVPGQSFMTVTIWENTGALLLEESLPGGCYQVVNPQGDCRTVYGGLTLLPADEYVLRLTEAAEGAQWSGQTFSFTVLPLQISTVFYNQIQTLPLTFDDVSVQDGILAGPSNDGTVSFTFNPLFTDQDICEAQILIRVENGEVISSSVGTIRHEQDSAVISLDANSVFIPLTLTAKCDDSLSDLNLSLCREAVRMQVGRTEGSITTTLNTEESETSVVIPVDDGFARFVFEKIENGIAMRNIGTGTACISDMAVLVPAGTAVASSGRILYGERTDYILLNGCTVPGWEEIVLPVETDGSFTVLFRGDGISPKQEACSDSILGSISNIDSGLFCSFSSLLNETECTRRQAKNGTLRTSSGEGRKNIVLVASDNNGNGCFTLTDENGDFSFFGMRNDVRYSLTVFLPDDAHPVSIPESVSVTDPMNLFFSQSSAIEGRTIPGATVRSDGMTVVADSDGWFRLSDFQTDRALITFTAPDSTYGFIDAGWTAASSICYSVIIPEEGKLLLQVPYTRLVTVSCAADHASLTITRNENSLTLMGGESISVLPGEYHLLWTADEGYLLNDVDAFSAGIEDDIAFFAETFLPASVEIDGIGDRVFTIDGSSVSDHLYFGPHYASVFLNDNEYLSNDADAVWHQDGNTVVASFMLEEGERLNLEAPLIAVYGEIRGICPDDVAVLAIHEDGSIFQAAVKDGYYVFSELKAGVYTISARYDGDKSPVLIGSDTVEVSGTVQEGPAVELRSSASLLVETFRDENVNGGRGKYEDRIRGVHVAVLDEHGFLLSEGDSDTEGNLLLTDIVPGTVIVRVTLPDGYIFTIPSTVNSGRGFAVIPQTCEKETDYQMELPEGETSYLTIGMVKAGSISGFAFLDTDGNGIYESTDSKLSGIAVTAQGTYRRAETVTNSDGVYHFDHLLPDTYTVTYSAPETYVFTRYSREGERNRSVLTDESNTGSVFIKVSEGSVKDEQNVGYVPAASISGIAFLDANDNGIYDVGESPYPGVLVELRRTTTQEVVSKTETDTNGNYAFPYLRTGRYDIRVLLPDDGSEYTFVTGDAYNQNSFFSVRRECIRSVVLDVGQKMNASIGCLYRAKLSGVVFSDVNYNGMPDAGETMLSDIRVTLSGQNGNGSKLTRNGAFTFDELLPGDYILTVDAPSGYTCSACAENSAPMDESDGVVTSLIHVPMGDEVFQYAALIRPAEISGLVFADENRNNAFDGPDSGTSGVKVALQGVNGSFETFTDNGGVYRFDKVMPGTYSISIELPYNSLCDTLSYSITVSAGQSVNGPAFPLLRYGTLDMTWIYHGIPLADVELDLESESNRYTFRSDSSGHMGSTSILPGEYKLHIRFPNDIAPVSGLAMTDMLSFFQGKQIILTQETVDASHCCGCVFVDANDNGVREAGEADAAGTVIRLYDENGALLEWTQTDSEGQYSFDNLVPGSYWLEISLDENSACNQSRVSLTVQEEGSHFNLSPFALVKLCTVRGSAELLLHEQRLHYGGLTLTLLETGAVTTTAPDGSYSFTHLRPGTYTLGSSSREYVFLLAGDKNYPEEQAIMMSQTSSRPIQVSNGETFEGSIVLLQPAVVGDLLFLDNNGNGLYDSTDDTVPGLTVFLLKDGEAVYTVKTDDYGYYLFDNVYPGKYRIAVDAPRCLTCTTHREDFTLVGSCLTGEEDGLIVSDNITFVSGEVNYNCDLGLRLKDGARKPDSIKPGPAQDWSGK